MLIDGSKFEGGGQILRTALALSTVTGKKFKIANIRKERKTPGLKNQHLACIKSLYQLFGVKKDIPIVGDMDFEFTPNQIKNRNINIDIGTAGSITLLLQSLIMPLIFSNKNIKIKIIGGTDVSWSPQIDYFSNVFIPQIRKYTEIIDFKVLKRGYYPKGGGEAEITVKSLFNFSNYKKRKITPVEKLELDNLLQIRGIAHASSDLSNAQVADRISQSAKSNLSSLKTSVTIRAEYSKTYSTGAGVTLWALFGKEEIDMLNPTILASDILGDKKKKSEEVGQTAAIQLQGLLKERAPVDSFLADQLIPFIALFGGKIKTTKITNHTLANVYTCEKFLGKRIDIDNYKNIISSIK